MKADCIRLNRRKRAGKSTILKRLSGYIGQQQGGDSSTKETGFKRIQLKKLLSLGISQVPKVANFWWHD